MDIYTLHPWDHYYLSSGLNYPMLGWRASFIPGLSLCSCQELTYLDQTVLPLLRFTAPVTLNSEDIIFASPSEWKQWDSRSDIAPLDVKTYVHYVERCEKIAMMQEYSVLT